jgi:hypothetical protein
MLYNKKRILKILAKKLASSDQEEEEGSEAEEEVEEMMQFKYMSKMINLYNKHMMIIIFRKSSQINNYKSYRYLSSLNGYKCPNIKISLYFYVIIFLFCFNCIQTLPIITSPASTSSTTFNNDANKSPAHANSKNSNALLRNYF